MNAMPDSSSERSNVHEFSQPAGFGQRAGVGAMDSGLALGEADLLRIERALLDALLDVHPNRMNALDHFLDDMDAADGANDDTASAAERDAGNSRRKQVEELLLTAVLDTTSDRNRALDRLLGGSPDPGVHAAYA